VPAAHRCPLAITFPNFESTTDDVTVQLDDFDKTATPPAAKPKPKPKP
jgi:hypothetical protein